MENYKNLWHIEKAFKEIKILFWNCFIYNKFNVESLPEIGELFINLRNVYVMATAKLNGKELGGT